MFVVGRRYILSLLTEEGSREELYGCEVLDYDEDKGLLKVSHDGAIKIFNVTSPQFFSATEQ